MVSLDMIVGNFNPRSYVRNDELDVLKLMGINISIHVPT